MTVNTYNKIVDKIAIIAKEVAVESMLDAANEICMLKGIPK